MSKLELTERASLEDLLEFANKVREAGGGNPLEALIPSIPHDTKKCLIARNLNFNCDVRGVYQAEEAALGYKRNDPDHEDVYHLWVMEVESKETRDKIAEALDLVAVSTVERGHIVVLPPEIGAVARDFDIAGDFYVPEVTNAFLPYIEASVKETWENDGSIIDGKLVI